MKLFIRIFALLILASCQDETIPNRQCYFSVTLSDALPVQFWQTGCSTYNETVPKGVHEKCWCAPWLCDDEIKIQFQEDLSPDTDYYLLARDSNGEYISDLPFTEISAGLHSCFFSPETEGICDKLISLEIADDEDIIRLLAPSDWDDPGVGGFTDFDTKNATQFIKNPFSAADNVIAATMPAVIPPGAKVSITYTVTISGTWTHFASGTTIKFFLKNGGINSASVGTNKLTDDELYITANGTYTFTEIITVNSESSILSLQVNSDIDSGSASVAISVPAGQVIYAPALAKSDCLDVRLSFDDDYPTELIEYSNTRNFAGLVYSDISPDASFNIRVPARFFHEVFPEEDEAIELTSSVITTSGQIKSQKLLEVMQAPYYFHKKLQLILKHQTVTINGTSYQKEEKYEIIENSKRWPLKQATCLLTEKNSVLRNVI